MEKIREWIDDLKMKSSDNFLPATQNDLIRELNDFSEFRKMSKTMRTEIIRRAGNDGLNGVLNALETIFDLGNAWTNPKGISEMFGTIDDYKLFGSLDCIIQNHLSGKSHELLRNTAR